MMEEIPNCIKIETDIYVKVDKKGNMLQRDFFIYTILDFLKFKNIRKKLVRVSRKLAGGCHIA